MKNPEDTESGTSQLEVQEVQESKNDEQEEPGRRLRIYKPYSIGCIRWLALASFVIEVFIIAVTIWFFFVNFKSAGLDLFVFHPTLMTFGVVCLMSIGILTESGFSTISRNLTEGRTHTHIYFMVGSMVSNFLGLTAIEVNKIVFKKKHFTSAHAYVGIFPFVTSLAAILWGAIVYNTKKRKLKFDLNTVKIVHYVFGLVTYFMSGATLILAFYSKWFQGMFNSHVTIIGTIAIVVICAFCSLKPVIIIYRRVVFLCINS